MNKHDAPARQGRILPVPFSPPMVRAIKREIEAPGTGKTQTRRVIAPTEKPLAPGQILIFTGPKFGGTAFRFAPRYRVGDLLYVREHWRCSARHDATAPRDLPPRSMTIAFEAGGSIANQGSRDDWRPSSASYTDADWMGRFRQGMHMPRWASRFTLLVTDVRVERLQDISEADALAEGIHCEHVVIDAHGSTGVHIEVTADRYWNLTEPEDFEGHECAADAYAELWDDLNAERGFGWDANPWVVAYTFRPFLGNVGTVAAKIREGEL